MIFECFCLDVCAKEKTTTTDNWKVCKSCMEHAMPCLIFPYPVNVCLFAAKRLCCQYSFPNSFLFFFASPRTAKCSYGPAPRWSWWMSVLFYSSFRWFGTTFKWERTFFQMKTCQNNKKFLDLTLCNVTCTYSDEIKIQNRIYHSFVSFFLSFAFLSASPVNSNRTLLSRF